MSMRKNSKRRRRFNMNEQRSLERRNLDRIKLIYYLRVYDRDSNEFVGSVFDLSMHGMKLICEKPFIVNSRYCMKINLPEGSILGESVAIEAQCRWRTDLQNNFEAGFEFVNKVDGGIYVIKTLIDDLVGNNQL
jgi:PilZ domain